MFEIRVAVIGYVSVGKTTLINALFGKEYGEVAMRRTTAIVNCFRIPSSTEDESTVKKQCKGGNGSEDDSVEFGCPDLSANFVLEETKSDNAAFRDSDVVRERTYDIVLDEPLHKMRPNTALTIVDIPGINEAGSSSKYQDYVNDNWHTFDTVVLVMDARQGVNTEEQHDILKLAKRNLVQAKDVPLIILCNKVDDPDSDEQTALLNEARKTIEELFDVSDRKSALEAFLDSSKQPDGPESALMVTAALGPAVVPISAMHAFVYRCGSRLSFEDFTKMDADFVDKIGKDSYGRRWKRFSSAERLKKAYETVSEAEQCQDGLEASNFGAFTKVLYAFIGNEENQTLFLEWQIYAALDRMTQAKPGFDLAAELLSAHLKLTSLGMSTYHLPEAFWRSYKALKKKALRHLENNFQADVFADPIDQLFNYAAALETLNSPREVETVLKETKELVHQYAIEITTSDQFKAKSPYDQGLIVGSMLLACGETFNANFGPLKLHLEFKYSEIQNTFGKPLGCQHDNLSREMYGKWTEQCNECDKIFVDTKVTVCPYCTKVVGQRNPRRGKNGGRGHCDTRGGYNSTLFWRTDPNGREYGVCSFAYCYMRYYLRTKCPVSIEMELDGGKLVPVKPWLYDKWVSVEVPDSLSNKKHFGYLFWKACQLLRESVCSNGGPEEAAW